MRSVLFASRILFLFCFFFVTLTGSLTAQTVRKNDVIVRKDNEKIEVVITEIDANTIRYKKVSDPDGPVFTVNKTDISSILYGNGEVEKFDKPTDEYFAPGSVPPPVIYKQEQPKTYNSAGGRLSGRDPEQLRSNYNLYVRKARSYRKLGFIGASAGLLFTVVGAAILSSAESYYNTGTGTYVSNDDAVAGALLVTAGLGGGIPLTIIGFVKNRSYTKKAIAVQNELRRRNQPLSLRLSPGFNQQTNTGYLSLKIAF
ncbi:hypothetical protein [Dyadobacter sp. LHD-138]|uniref:hypothetical protein n=1 Tax=Dyadobacter sp. LHD-138 TaxID=3071413 RepID=UPI0027E045A7|nr:hypothetical protein [Dyadobacter sp. LHD-138]MDQ6480478.1 hypothetical protein [Dyadobacter sp. LHD-138]